MTNNLKSKVAHLKKLFVNNPSKRILWIYGRSGYGKTALASQLTGKTTGNGKRVCYLSMDSFVREIVQRIKERKLNKSFISQYKNYNFLIFDHVDLALNEKPKTQLEIRYLILRIIKNKKTKVILLTNKKPTSFKNLKFKKSICCYTHLKKPTPRLKLNLLRNWGLRNNVSLPERTTWNIIKISDNLFQLRGLFNQVLEFMKQRNKKDS